jgi:hypothetical protein
MPFACSPSRLFGGLLGQIALVFMLGLAPPQPSAIRVLAASIPGAVPPEFEAVLAADVSPSESRTLLTALASTMRSLDDDDVSFTTHSVRPGRR